MNKNIMRRLTCLILCFCLVSISSVNVFAGTKSKNSFLFGNSFKETKKEKQENINPIQSFILDSMDSGNNQEIAIELSRCTENNIEKTTSKIVKLLKGSWNSKKGMAKLQEILEMYVEYTPKAKYCLWSVIDTGFDGVTIPVTLSSKLKSKINYDFTGDKSDDRGTKFMVKSLLILDEVAELDGETLLSIKTNKKNVPTIKLNRLENYSYITSSIDYVLYNLDTLPLDTEDFDCFIDYYESYINDCGVYGIVSFLRLLDANGIAYTARK